MRITATLPYPPSTNVYWRTFRGRTVPSKAATDYKKTVRTILEHAVASEDNVLVDVTLLPKLTQKGVASKVCIDLDNCLKVLLDALQGLVIADDKQVKEIHARYGEPVCDGGVTITIQTL